MGPATDKRLGSREEAGRSLSKRLRSYMNTDAIVVGIPSGGFRVASEIARKLSLTLAALPCRKIMHPANSRKIIGAISTSDVILCPCSDTVPQDYIYHQIGLLRNAIQHDCDRYYGDNFVSPFFDKTIILVDDVLQSAHGILACIETLKRDKPLKIIVAVPVVTAEAAGIVRAEADDIVFLQEDTVIDSPQDCFSDARKADPDEIDELIFPCRV